MGLVPGNRESRMTIGEIVRQGFHYARSYRSLWLFGFFVGIASGGSNGGGGGGGDSHVGGIAGGLWFLSVAQLTVIALVVILVGLTLFVLRFVGEGALIEGVARIRKGEAVTTRDGFRAGWAHWWVLVRIAVIYFVVSILSLALLAAPCVIAMQTMGAIGAVAFGLPAAIVAVPWLVTLYLVQAFASRIAVLENRQALDAIRKARLFLHGRLSHGLKLIVATFIGSLAIALVAILTLAPVALALVALMPVVHFLPLIVVACLVLVPVTCVLAAILGTYRSSIWTIGYVTQVES
jgi:hypothetical protein